MIEAADDLSGDTPTATARLVHLTGDRLQPAGGHGAGDASSASALTQAWSTLIA